MTFNVGIRTCLVLESLKSMCLIKAQVMFNIAVWFICGPRSSNLKTNTNKSIIIPLWNFYGSKISAKKM